ncbi:hypothetical protein PV10_01193 [Exophiala mesophila]|uniref:Uncharacterized protein n=1 Tax=Exophiala mesophila TaxID=212818 RepID=A0A0D1X6I2_EXOME|nr:uncharacterized protein PV10_01193 [Exophiala mesophila]KIV97440.1 hypothetical protein PV10_01193 [Exophiala mesophila]
MACPPCLHDAMNALISNKMSVLTKLPPWARSNPFDTDGSVEKLLARIALNTQTANSFLDRANAASDITDAPWLRKYTTTLKTNELFSADTLDLARGLLDLQIQLYVDLRRCSVDKTGERVWKGLGLLPGKPIGCIVDQLRIMESEVEKDLQVWRGLLRLGLIVRFLERELERLETKRNMEDQKQHEVQDTGGDKVMQMLEEFFSGHDPTEESN